MTQPLHFTPKAIADLSEFADAAKGKAPATRDGILYLIEKLKSAEVFVLSDSGQLLDRGKARPELPGLVLRPPFPVVALEYLANPTDWKDPIYTPSSCSKRIALAWDFTDDLPASIAGMLGRPLPRGVIIAAIAFYDEHQKWMPISVAAHIDYEDDWFAPKRSAFYDSMVAAGRISPAVAQSRTLPGSVIPLSPETVFVAAATFGIEQAMDMMSADLMDEAAAYMDLCWALACKNVSVRHSPAPENLNRQRAKTGKPALFGFHVLELAGETIGGAPVASSPHASPRSHLRRGHIRRLSPDRVTWVNQSMVRGRGFIDKQYSVKGAAK